MRVVVSVVTGEFGRLARAVQQRLEEDGHHVLLLLGDRAGEVPLPDRAQYIATANAVVTIIGERSGDYPSRFECQALGDIAYQYNFRSDTGTGETSYLQWDLLLACQLDVPVLLARPGVACAPDGRNPERGDRQTDQRRFRSWLREVDMPTVAAADPDGLADAIHRALLPPAPIVVATATAAIPAE